MKKVIYQRNSKGQYVFWITTRNFALACVFTAFIIGGFIHSVNAGRSAGGIVSVRDIAVVIGNTKAAPEHACETNQSGACDLTDDATKIRIYELTDGGKRAIKWYGKTVTATVTAYTSRVEETDATPCIAADGSDICERYAKGERICASNDYKLGTALDIKGLGRCIVSDRMNKRYTGTGRVDYYMGYDLTAARQWGARKTSISLTQ